MSFLQKIREISGHAGAIYDLDGDESFIYTASGDSYVAKWNNSLGIQEKFAIKAEKAVYSICLLSSKKQLVFACSDGAFHVIDLENKQEVKHVVQHKVAIFSILEDLASNQIYMGDADGNLSVWNSVDWTLKLFIPFDCGKIRSIFKHPTLNTIFLSCQDGRIREIDTKRFNEVNNWFAHKDGANCFAFFPLKPNACISGGKDGFLRIWKHDTLEKILEIPAHNFGIYSITFINGGKHFVSTSRDKTLKLWDAQTLQVLEKKERKDGGHSHAVNACLKLSETEIVTVGDDKRIIFWELNL